MHPSYKWLWKSHCQPRRKFFFWLLLKDRLSTRALLRRKNMYLECYNCVLCHLNTEESLMHLFFDCPFAMACRNVLGFAHLIQNDHLAMLSAFKDHFQRPFFMEVFISMCWAIWTTRNDSIFRNLQYSVSSCVTILCEELALVKLRTKDKYQPMFDQWLVSFV